LTEKHYIIIDLYFYD